MNIFEIKKVEPILTNLIHKAIVDSVKFVVDKCRTLKTSPQEPDFIGSLTLNFSRDLFNILKAVFPRNKFSVTGVYCHQKPLADIGLPKKPELGDLLIVYVYTDNYGNKMLNSILFQAKMTSSHLTTVSKADAHQLKLYSEWPTFRYERAGKLNGVERDILPKTINDGAQYLLLDNHPVFGLSTLTGTFPIGCATPNKILALNNDLATEVIQFLKFKSGRPFEQDNLTTHDDWTKMIWEILMATKDKASKRRNSGIGSFPRQVAGNFDGCCAFVTESKSILHDLHAELAGGKGDAVDLITDDNNNSLSIIVIESVEQAEG